MPDDPTSPTPSNPAADAAEMINETINELTTVFQAMPVPAYDAEKIAMVLDRAAEDIAEVAVLVRRAATRETRLLP